MTHCVWCGVVPDPDRDPESVLVKSERSPNASVCARCICYAVVELYRGGLSLTRMRDDLLDLFIVSGDVEQEMKREILDRLRAEYQQQFLELRDREEPNFNEAEKTSVSVMVTRYTFDRMTALSREANMTVSSWIRQAIMWAFHATTHKRS